MKQILILILVIGISSCQTMEQFQDGGKFNSVTEILLFVSYYIQYPDPYPIGKSRYWQPPEETLELGTGDCKDYATLAGWLIKRDLGIETQVIIATPKNYSGSNHAMLSIDGIWVSPEQPQIEFSNDYIVIKTFEMSHVMKLLQK